MTPFDDFEALDAAGGVELHDATEHEAVFVGAQAADVGRKLLRQHGDGAIGEVDAGAAQAGFEIERGVGENVLGDVGDVDLELVSRRGRVRATRTASSKSRAVSPSMVTMGSERKSRRRGGFGGIEMGDGARFGEHVLREDARQAGACGSSSRRRRQSRRASRGPQ